MSRLPNASFWKDRRVFITGHQGFKGAWLTYMLSSMGAHTCGFGRDNRDPLLYNSLSFDKHRSVEGDVSDLEALRSALLAFDADIALHLAAQPLVLSSYADPIGTFRDNIMGTANLLEAVRAAPQIRSVVIVTSDKVYRNNGWAWGYREGEALGGHDPYSASKAAAEIVADAMRSSFFSEQGSTRIATARAGNVIGGGDWAEFRLLPDAARALSVGDPLVVRNPYSTRPWQHVLEPLGGYLVLAEELAAGRATVSNAWNYGPANEDAIPVSQVADLFVAAWGGSARWELSAEPQLQKEASFLAVDSSLVRREFGWTPKWRVDEAVARTARWYRDAQLGQSARSLLDRDIADYMSS